MDGMEVVGTQHHAAASPFLLSSPPPGHHHHHHHHHHHATFNLQAVQLSFDACLAYNTSASSSSGSGARGSSPIAATSLNSCNVKSMPCLTLSNCPPLHPAASDSPELHTRHHHHNHNNNRAEGHLRHHRHPDAPASPSESASGCEKRHHLHRHDQTQQQRNIDDEDECNGNCRDEHNRDNGEKDKPGDLNTPVTTSSDLPSFFGPSANLIVEPPPISGTVSRDK